MFNLTIYYCDFYEGRGRRENPNRETRLLLASKYHGNLEARTRIVSAMHREAVDHLLNGWSVITYALARDWKVEHAKLLALDLARRLCLEVIPPSEFHKHDVSNRRVLMIDDVCTTGRTLRRLALEVLEHRPAGVDGLVYLKTHTGAGLPISRPRK